MTRCPYPMGPCVCPGHHAVRVLVLSDLWLPFPGGAERLMFNLARELDQRGGFEIRVLTGYELAQAFDGPPVDARSIGTVDEPGWKQVEAVIDGFGPDVILTHHHYARLFEWQLSSLGIPIVQVVLNGGRLPCAAHAVYITEHVRGLDPSARASDQTIWPPATVDVVASSHGDAIGFIKPIRHKGVDLFWRLAAAMPDRRFVCLRGEWQTLEIVHPRPNVLLLDPVDDIRQFWARVDRVIVPSLSEDAGTVAQEATANGVPCISSDVDGLRETNGGGIRLDPTDLLAWQHAIRVLDNPVEYDAWVAGQRRWYDAHDHPARLAALADTIRMIA